MEWNGAWSRGQSEHKVLGWGGSGKGYDAGVEGMGRRRIYVGSQVLSAINLNKRKDLRWPYVLLPPYKAPLASGYLIHVICCATIHHVEYR